MKHDDCTFAVRYSFKEGEVNYCNELKAFITDKFCDNCCIAYIQSRPMAKARGEE